MVLNKRDTFLKDLSYGQKKQFEYKHKTCLLVYTFFIKSKIILV